MYSLRMSAWIVPESCSAATGPFGGAVARFGGGDVEGEHDRGGSVDRHRHRYLAEVDAAEQRLHVVERVDRDALAADLAERARVVGVVAHQRGHVEGGGEAGLAVLEQVAEALVRLLARAEAGELAHRPQAAAVHRGVDAAGERVGAGEPDGVLGAADPRRAGPRPCRARARARRRACARRRRPVRRVRARRERRTRCPRGRSASGSPACAGAFVLIAMVVPNGTWRASLGCCDAQRAGQAGGRGARARAGRRIALQPRLHAQAGGGGTGGHGGAAR